MLMQLLLAQDGVRPQVSWEALSWEDRRGISGFLPDGRCRTGCLHPGWALFGTRNI